MGLRFRRSVRLAPGIRLNFSGSGISTTIGGRGHSVNIGRRGTYLNAGIPGTGISMRERIGGGSPRAPARRAAPQHVQLQVQVRVDDNGVVHFEDQNGIPLPDNLVRKAKSQQRETIRGLMEKQASDINGEVQHVQDVHLDTPPPTEAPRFTPSPFDQHEPMRPVALTPGILGWFFKAWVARTERLNAAARKQYEDNHKAWQWALDEHKVADDLRKDFIENKIRTEPSAMEEFLENSFHEIHWPVEIETSFELGKDPSILCLDIQLPEASALPRRRASVPDSKWSVTIRDLSDKDRQLLYARYAHGVGFKLAGESFAALQVVQSVVLSAFAQRPDPATGTPRPDCLYSVRIPRETWAKISFRSLRDVDPAAALGGFEIRRKVAANGAFTTVEPFAHPGGGDG
jgi:hypothetical protein